MRMLSKFSVFCAVCALAVLPVRAGDDSVGLGATVRLPYTVVSKIFAYNNSGAAVVNVIDTTKPLFYKSGDYLYMSNIRVDINGIAATPTIVMKPFYEGPDKIAIKIQRIMLHMSMSGPKTRRTKNEPELTQEELMGQVMDGVVDMLQKCVSDALGKHTPPGSDTMRVLKMTYDRDNWMVHATIWTNFPFASLGDYMNDVHITGFAITDSAFMLKLDNVK